MIRGNLRLVLSVVQRFSGRGECMDDLFQVGCIGLIKAIDNFDPELNVRFSTYGVPMIVGEIRRFLRDNNPLRVSVPCGTPPIGPCRPRSSCKRSWGGNCIREMPPGWNDPSGQWTLALEAVGGAG